MTKEVRILILEDRPADAELAERELRKEGIQFTSQRVMTEPDYLAQLREFAPDLILADYSLPSYDGLSALAAAQRERPEVPFIFVSGELGEETAIEALHHGATDYVLKRRLSRLGGVARRALQENAEKRNRQQAEKALREADARFRVLFERSPDGIVIVDPETARLLEFNTIAHQQLGYTREEFARLSIPDLEAMETPEETMAHIAKIVREGKDDFDTRKRTKEGEIRHIHVTAQVVEVAGRPVYHCIWRDITERKRAEDRIRELNQLLRAIRDINQLIVGERDPSRLLAEACRILVQGRGFSLAWVGLVEPGSKRVLPAACAGECRGYLETLTVTWDESPNGLGPVGTAIRSGHSCAFQNIANDPLFAPWRERALACGFAAVAAVPMIRDGRVLGAVTVYSGRVGAFDAEELALLIELAADLALALHNTELENERRQAEARMRLLSQALESAANAIVITDREGTISWVNPAFTQLTGYSLAEAVGQKASLLKSGVHDPGFYRALWETILAGKVWSTVMINRRKDGSRYTEENTITPVRDECGEITHFIAIKQDITARQQAAEAVRQREEYFRALTEKATDVTTVLNADATIRYVSPSTRQVLGYTPEEMLGRIAFDFVHPEDLLRLQEVFSANVGTAGAVALQEFRFRHKDGTWRALEATARNLIDDPSVQGIVVNSRDITQRKQAELQREAFAKLGEQLSAAKTARETGEIIVAAADRLVGWDACTVHAYSLDTDRLYHILSQDTMNGQRADCSPAGHDEPPSPLVRRAIDRGAQLILKDDHPLHAPDATPFGDTSRASASIMFVPVRDGARVIGVLSIHSYTPRAYDEHSLETLQALADHCAGALDRIGAQEALGESERNYREIFNAAHDAIFVHDAVTGAVLDVNQRTIDMLGFSHAELCDQAGDLFGPDEAFSRPEAMHRIRQAFAKGPQVFEWRTKRKSGELFWSEVTLRGTRIAGEARVLAVMRDISERKQAEAALRESEQFSQQIVANAQEGIVVYDRELRYKVWNPFMERLTGLSAGEVLGKRAAEVFPFLRDAGVVASAEGTLRGETTRALEFPFSISAAAKSGWVCQTNGPLRNGGSQITGVIGIVRDISERKRAQARIEAFSQLGQRLSAAKAAKEAAQIIVETADQMLGWDACNFALYSPATKLIHHVLNRDTFDGRRIESPAAYDHAPPSPVAKRAIEQGGQLILKEHPEQMTPDGVAFGNKARPSASILFVPIRNGTDVLGVMTIQSYTPRAYDQHSLDTLQALADHCGGALDRITTEETLRTAQQQLRQSQKLEAIGQLAGGVAHDFNNMLAIIGGNAELLMMDGDQLATGTKEGLKQIMAASERAANLTRQLLAFSRKQVMQSQPVVLNKVIADLVKMLKRIIGEQVDLQCHYADPLPFVQADAGMIEQVLVNLAVNARDAMPHGGQLLITTERVTLDAPYAQTHPEARAGEFVCLALADAGTGIAPEHLAQIFEPFFTTKDVGKGTGLGLATVYGIVKQHQGWIQVSSQLGAGTTFKVFLPAIPAPAKAAVASKAEADLPGGTETILLVEDDYAVRVITRRVLESHGYTVYEASTAREGLELWRRSAEEIALLLTDIVMPEGLTGRDLAEQLRALKPTLKIIFMSGYSADVIGKDTDFFRRSKSLLLQKPCPVGTLLKAVRRCLDEK